MTDDSMKRFEQEHLDRWWEATRRHYASRLARKAIFSKLDQGVFIQLPGLSSGLPQTVRGAFL